MMTWTLTINQNLTRSNSKEPSPQSYIQLSSSIKALVRIQLISVIVLLHSKTAEAQWTQHGVGYDGQCCITRPDGLFGSAIVLATWWICIHFLHGQHGWTDPSLPLEKEPTEPHSRLRHTATYHLLFYSVSFQSVFCLFIIKARGLTPWKLLQCLQSIKGRLYLSTFKLVLNLDFLCPSRSGGNRSDLVRTAAPLSSACLRTWGNWFH